MFLGLFSTGQPTDVLFFGQTTPSPWPSFPLLPTVLCVELSLHGFCKVLINMIVVLYLANLKFKQSHW